MLRPVSPADARRADRGFTLIELLVALTILALAMGVAGTTLLRQGTSFDVRATTGQVSDLLRTARQDAQASGKAVAVEFDGDARKFASRAGPGLVLPKGIEASVMSASSAGRGRIVFFENGTSTGGEIEIFSETRRDIIAVDWLTGAITREDARS